MVFVISKRSCFYRFWFSDFFRFGGSTYHLQSWNGHPCSGELMLGAHCGQRSLGQHHIWFMVQINFVYPVGFSINYQSKWKKLVVKWPDLGFDNGGEDSLRQKLWPVTKVLAGPESTTTPDFMVDWVKLVHFEHPSIL